MTALAQNADRRIAGGDFACLPSEVSANPYQGSLLSFAADGYVHELVAGEVFAGVCARQIPTAEVAAADGGRTIDAITGEFLMEMALSGVGQDDAQHRRPVFASDDATLTFTASNNTPIGHVVGVAATDVAIIAAKTNRAPSKSVGVVTLAATGNETITTAMLNRLILVPNTGAKTLTLPAAADCAGATLTFKKTTSDAQAITLDGNASETIDGATTNATMDAGQDMLSITCDGSNWHITAAKIA